EPVVGGSGVAAVSAVAPTVDGSGASRCGSGPPQATRSGIIGPTRADSCRCPARPPHENDRPTPSVVRSYSTRVVPARTPGGARSSEGGADPTAERNIAKPSGQPRIVLRFPLPARATA